METSVYLLVSSCRDWPSQMRHTVLCACVEWRAKKSSLSEGNIWASSIANPRCLQDTHTHTHTHTNPPFTTCLLWSAVDLLIKYGEKLMFCASWDVALQIPACLVTFLKVVTSLLCRDPNGADEPEVIRCVDILRLVSQFVVYIF